MRSLYEKGAVKTLEVEAKRYRMYILAIQETHIKETKVTKLEEYVLFTSGGKTRRYGVGFLVSKELKEKIVKFEPISDRITGRSQPLNIEDTCPN